MRVAFVLACVAIGLSLLARQSPVVAADRAQAPAVYDFKQKLSPDPAYKDSAEKKYRERLRVRMHNLAREAARMAHERALARAQRPAARRYHTARYRRAREFPFLNTLFWSGVGAIAGHQRHRAWEGAAIGAGVGGLLDGWAYHRRRR